MKYQNSAFNILFGILKMLPNKYKIRIFIIFIFMLLGGFLEFLSIGLMLPFLKVLTNTYSDINDGSIVNKNFNVDFFNQFSIEYLGIFLIIIIFLSGFLRLYINWKTELISASIGNKIGHESFQSLISQKYENYLLLDIHKQITIISIQISKCISAINAFLIIISSILITFFIFISLIVINPLITFSLSISFILVYLIIVKFAHQRLKRNSKIISDETRSSLKYVKNSMSGFRDMKLNQSESFFLKEYIKSDYKLRKHQAYSNFFAIFPRFAIEPLIITILILLSIFLFSSSIANIILPILGSFALGVQKLLPNIQQIYAGWARLKNSQTDLENVYSLFLKGKKNNSESFFYIDNLPKKDEEFVFSEIVLENINYKYPGSNKNVIKDLNLQIVAGDIVGIRGKTGSGKTTLVDIIACLLIPNSGNIFINGNLISNNMNNKYRDLWSRNLSYIPQNIFLSDQSISQNVAFGLPNNLIDFQRVKECLRMAQLSEFANYSLDRLTTEYVGDGGIRISGGQRQRIAIARSLYRKSKVLIIDEGTSALDNETEGEIIKLISKLSKKLTIIMIAHRISTLAICNKIIDIQNGKITNNTL